MAMLEYSQNGISARALEEAKRRLAARGGQTPYPSTVSGLTEGVTEREINRAQVAGEDPEEAAAQVGADPRRISTMLRAPMSDMQPAQSPGPMQLREPMTGAPQGMGAQPMTPPVRAPMVAPEPPPPAMGQKGGPADPELTRRARIADEDRADRAQAEALNRRARRDAALTALMTALPDGAADVGAVQAAAARHDPNAPMQARAAARAAEEEARIAEEERALNTDYRRTLMRSMDVNANRRESEMSRTGDRDARNYDPAHPLAQQRREFLRRIMASAPEIARGLEGQDLDAMGSADLRNVTDQTLRRIGQTPNRLRQADIDEMMRVAAQLDAADGATTAPEPVQAAPETAEAVARRRLGRPAPTGAQAPPGALVAPPRQDRSLDGIVADIMAERGGQATSTGQPAREFTQREREVIARGMRSSRTRAAAQLAGGLGTTGQEAQIAQVGQTGAYTQRDVNAASRLLAPVVSRRRQTASLLSRARDLSDAEFAAAMQNSPAFLRTAGFNVETFNADFRALTNVALREASGAAVTDSEAQRFFAALSSNSFSSKAAFMAALQRMLAEDANNARAVVPREEVRNAYFTQLRGAR